MENFCKVHLVDVKWNLIDTLNFHLVFSKSFNTSFGVIGFMNFVCVGKFIISFFDKFCLCSYCNVSWKNNLQSKVSLSTIEEKIMIAT